MTALSAATAACMSTRQSCHVELPVALVRHDGVALVTIRIGIIVGRDEGLLLPHRRGICIDKMPRPRLGFVRMRCARSTRGGESVEAWRHREIMSRHGVFARRRGRRRRARTSTTRPARRDDARTYGTTQLPCTVGTRIVADGASQRPRPCVRHAIQSTDRTARSSAPSDPTTDPRVVRACLRCVERTAL